MARKKIVLVIVEGPSDDVALGMALNQVYDKDSVYVHIMHGDITTRRGVTSQNIVAKIGNDVTTIVRTKIKKMTRMHLLRNTGARCKNLKSTFIVRHFQLLEIIKSPGNIWKRT